MQKVTFLGSPLTLNKAMIKAGDKVQDTGNLRGADLQPVKLPTEGKYILSIAPSLDTEVCQIQTKTLDSENLPVITITVDLPFAQARWCGANHVGSKVYSDYFDREFLKANGLFVNELAIGTRAVLIVKDGVVAKVLAKEEIAEQVDFAAIKEAYNAI